MIIDATNLILGRMGTVVAKKAMLGEEVLIVNCEKAIITGGRDFLLAKYQNRIKRGIPLKGPYFPRIPDRLVRRSIRGMLPYKKARGNAAFHRIMCYQGVPEVLKDRKAQSIKEAHASRLNTLNYLPVGELCKLLGAKR